jgi:hypothetical protein
MILIGTLAHVARHYAAAWLATAIIVKIASSSSTLSSKLQKSPLAFGRRRGLL